MKKIILIVIATICFINVSALTYGGCDYSTVARMKSIVNNVNLSYDYTMIDNKPYFNVTITNITDDIYMVDTVTKNSYYYSDTNEGEITIYNYSENSGQYKFYSNNASCKDIKLGTKYYNFPEYNRYYNHEYCSDIPNYSLCQKWVSVNYSKKEFEEKILEYKNKKSDLEEEKVNVEYKKTLIDDIIELYSKYYYFFLGVLVIIGSIIIFVNDKKNRFKL